MAPRLWTCLARTAQFEATPRESDPRSTAGARRAPGRIRHARRGARGHQKTRGGWRCGFGCSGVDAFSRGKRSLRPPCLSSGRRSVLCCALSRLFLSLAYAGFAAGAKPNQRFFACQQLGRFFFAPARRVTVRGSGPRRDAVGASHSRPCTSRARARRKTSENMRFLIAHRRACSAMHTRVRRAGAAQTEAERDASPVCSPREENDRLARRTSPIAPICANRGESMRMRRHARRDRRIARAAAHRSRRRHRAVDASARRPHRARRRRSQFQRPKNEEGRGLPRPSGDTT